MFQAMQTILMTCAAFATASEVSFVQPLCPFSHIQNICTKSSPNAVAKRATFLWTSVVATSILGARNHSQS